MDNDELKTNFLQWIATKAPVTIPNDLFLLAALDASIKLTFNTFIDKKPFIEVRMKEDIYRYVLQLWKSHCLVPLSTLWSDNVKLNLYGVEVPIGNPKYMDELQRLFYQLETQCLE